MIVGTRYWNDASRYYSQVNNPTEEELRKLGVTAWLQSCGSSAAATGMATVGYDLEVVLPGGAKAQADELITDYLNDPGNYDALRSGAPGIDPTAQPNNRHAAYLPIAGRAVFGARGLHWTGFKVGDLYGQLRKGRAVQVCLVPPGHYVCAVAYDDKTGEIIYDDSWPTRVPLWYGDGFCRRFTSLELKCVVSEGVVWCPPGDMDAL